MNFKCMELTLDLSKYSFQDLIEKIDTIIHSIKQFWPEIQANIIIYRVNRVYRDVRKILPEIWKSVLMTAQ